MEDEAMDDLPLLEEADVDAPVLDERLIADEESRRDSRDTPLRQTPVIQSIHCGCYLGQRIDVKQVARKLWNAVFDPKVISMGAKSEASALIACRKVARMIQRLAGYESVMVTDFKVHNVTASGALGYRVDLRALARHPTHEEHCEYNPDQFPGLHYKLLDAASVSSASTSHSHPAAAVKAEAPSSGNSQSRPSSAAVEPAVNASASSGQGGAAVAPTATSLTLTFYFSGRFTLVGAQHESDVYRHFEHISRLLFPFSSVHSRQQQQQQQAQAQGQVQGVDSKLALSYEAWLGESSREERLKGGRMGWEEEADRVRMEMDKRDRRRSRVQAGAQQAGGHGVRVKAEPGVPSTGVGVVRDESKEASASAVARIAAVVQPTAEQRSRQPIEPLHTAHSAHSLGGAGGGEEEKTGSATDKKVRDGDTDEKTDTERLEGAAHTRRATQSGGVVHPAALVVAAHDGVEEKAGEMEEEVEWE